MPKKRKCPKCGCLRFMSRHHIYPRRHFGRKSNHILLLCRPCHNKLELLIPYRKMPKEFYIRVVENFLGGDV